MHSWRTRSGSLLLLLFLFLADLTCSVLLAFTTHHWSFEEVRAAWPDGLTRFSSDCLDGVLMALGRLLAMVAIGLAAVRWGTPQHELQLDARKNAVKARERARAAWRKKHGRPEEAEDEEGGSTTAAAASNGAAAGGVTRKVLLNGLGATALADEIRQPLLNVQEQQSQQQPHAQSSVIDTGLLQRTVSWNLDATTAAASPKEDEALAAFERTLPPLPPLVSLSDSEKLVQSRRAQFIRHTLVALLFTIATLMQIYLGVKLIGFSFSNEWEQGLMMAAVIICVNAEQSVLRLVIDHLTKEQGYLFLSLHPHRIFYDEGSVGHRCDLCRGRIRASYRCSQCDFDCCSRCFVRKDKVRGENQLRGDKGAKNEAEVSSVGYMYRALKLARPHAWIIALAVVCLLATSAAAIILPNFQGSIIDAVIRMDKHDFERDVKLYILISVGLGFFGAIRSLAFNIVGAHIANDVRNRLFKAIIHQDIVFFDGVSTGELTSRLSSDTAAMTSPMQTVLSSTLSNLLLLVGGFVMCILTSWRLTVLAMTSIYPIIIITRAYAKWSSQINKQIWAALGDASTVANMAISNIRTVRSFGTEELEVKKYTDATTEALDKSILDAYANGGTYALTSYLDLGTTVLLLWYGGAVAMGQYSGSLTIGGLVTFQLYWNMLNGAYTSLVSVLNSFTRASGAAQRVLTLMDNLPDIDPRGGLDLDSVEGEIEIRDMSFAYQMRPDNPVLKGVNLTIPAHTVTALVGRSGGGKSTLVNLLQRFYDCSSGQILLDGHDFTSLNLSSLHKHMAVVTQTTELFAGTILQNLTYGMEDGAWDMPMVTEACIQANAHEFIDGFEEGYETRIGERGVRLSGGQKQRLSIARAMLRRARLLFLDEATSSLDAESESLVQAALDKLIARGHCTILLVAHRLSTVINADQIVVLDQGRIAERGTHDQLVAADGIYAKLVNRQLARKQNLIEDEAVGAAANAHSKQLQEQAKKDKLSKLDDFDSLFEEQKEQEQATAVSPTSAGAAAASSLPAAVAASSQDAPRSETQ